MDDPKGVAPNIDSSALDPVIKGAVDRLLARQADDGHWIFELEADATIPAEYIMLNHYLDEINDPLEQKIAAYLRNKQLERGGWPLFHDGGFNMSASVKAYFALKLAGDAPEAPHMVKARNAIRARGGAAEVNVFTRIALALFRQIPWRATPVSRVELLLLPKWFPWNIYKMSYWTRTVMVPLLVLTSLRPAARNPRAVNIDELFLTPPAESPFRLANPTGHILGSIFIAFDRLIFPFQRFIPGFATQRAVKHAMAFIDERLNGQDGLGGIFPAMVNALLAYDALGYAKDDPRVVATRKAIDDLVIERDDTAYCQPCVSPVWDTALAAQALMEASSGNGVDAVVGEACDWLVGRQVLDVHGDWNEARPETRPGGWAFQYWNDHYPDVDDTAVVVMALHRDNAEKHSEAISRGAEWVLGMQSSNGGWAAFDADNDYELLENIPFADHGALLDPPTADVSARSVSMLAQLGYDRSLPAVEAGIKFLIEQQEEDGSWFGRWGTNYVYGTWSVLSALNAIGEDMDADYIRRAVAWLESRQRFDGGWGEDCATYWMEHRTETKASTPSQTAWAVLALLAAGEVNTDTVRRGIRYLVESRNAEGAWDEEFYNAVGFPRVFYLLYHGYREYFPLWALARYRNLNSSNSLRPSFGM